jgi:hypothetical protein
MILTKLMTIEMQTTTNSAKEEMTRTTELKVQDVICSSKKRLQSTIHSPCHPGNARLRVLAQMNASTYIDADKATKIKIARRVVNIVNECGGRFLLFDGDTWCTTNEIRAIKEGTFSSSYTDSESQSIC